MMSIFTIVMRNDIKTYNELINTIDINILDKGNINLLQEAITNNSNEIALDLIRRGINVNNQDYKGQTPLHYAASRNNYLISEAIIKNGGNVNVIDSYGNSSLWTAALTAKGKYDLVELFVSAGGDVNHKNNAGRSPLDFAKQIGNENFISILIGSKK